MTILKLNGFRKQRKDRIEDGAIEERKNQWRGAREGNGSKYAQHMFCICMELSKT